MKCATAIRKRLGLTLETARYARTSTFTVLKYQIKEERDLLWQRILDVDEPTQRPDPQLIFEICKDVESECSYFNQSRICFLIDDYSKQRIPAELQRRLNQVITFSKQGSPIFKVSSEYDGVDLDGINQPREVTEVNIGFEYVSFQNDSNRHRFLKSILNQRLKYLELTEDVEEFLLLSGLSPAIPLAKEIKKARDEKRKFYYHGLDTISDLCSGDFAMGIELVRRVFDHGNADWSKSAKPIPIQKQNSAIQEFVNQEFEYIRHQSRHGLRKYRIADSLAWFSKQSILTRVTTKDGKEVPLLVNHIDIADRVIQELEETLDYADPCDLFQELITKGVLFPLQPSRSMRGDATTQKFMLRRILLARHTSALGRFRPIRIDDIQRLLFFLNEPLEFVKDELKSKQSSENPDQDEGNSKEQELEVQQDLPFGGNANA